MKKLLLLALSVVCVFSVLALTKPTYSKISSPTTIALYGGTGDTIVKNGNITQVFPVAPFCTGVKYKIETTRIRGSYTKVRTIMYESWDAVNYTVVDTLNIATSSASSSGSSTLATPKLPYIKLVTTAIDSTQTVRIKTRLLIDNR